MYADDMPSEHRHNTEPRATRNYVVLGLLFMTATALAVREFMRRADAGFEEPRQQSSAELEPRWPRSPGDLAGPWQRVRAVPVLGGVVIETLPVRRSEQFGELAFVPNEALASGRDPIAARRPCVGANQRTAESEESNLDLDVSPDGRLLARPWGTNGGMLDVYLMILDSPDVCKLELMSTGVRPNSGWPDSVPWWSSDDMIVALGNIEPDVLFPKLERDDPAATILDAHPTDPNTWFVITRACPPSHQSGDVQLQRPCMHRVHLRFEHILVPDKASPEPDLISRSRVDVHTLGPIDPYSSLAISADGTRAAYVTSDSPGCFTMAIDEPGLGPIERIDAAVHPESKVRLSPDGRVIVVGGVIAIQEHGSHPTARAFLLAPPQPESGP